MSKLEEIGKIKPINVKVTNMLRLEANSKDGVWILKGKGEPTEVFIFASEIKPLIKALQELVK